MKEIWTLIIKTSLPETCKDAGDIKTTVTSYEKFEAAKAAMQKELRQLAFSKNTMFDGKGHISYFEKYIEDKLRGKNQESSATISEQKNATQKSLHSVPI